MFPLQPSITKYPGQASFGLDNNSERLLLENPLDFMQNSIKAWKDDIEYYKMLLEEYKNKKYQKEQASLDKIIVYIYIYNRWYLLT
jgi:hypothetical protein